MIKSNQHRDSKEDFNIWLNNPNKPKGFKIRHGGFFPCDIDKWHDKVEENHQDIRNWLGGVRKSIIIKLNAQQNQASEELARPIINSILNTIPDYLNCYGFDESVFLSPSIRQGTHNSIRVGKHIRSYAENYLRNDPSRDYTLRDLDRKLAALRTIWAKAKTQPSTLEVTLTTSPRAFVLLGHYGPDADSCFRNGSDKTADKFVMGQSKDSFVLVISKLNEGTSKFEQVARAFGFTSNNFKYISVCNFYYSDGLSEGDSIEAIKTFVEQINGESYKLLENKIDSLPYGDGEALPLMEKYIRSVGRSVFLNKFAQWTFVPATINDIPKQAYFPDINGIKIFECPHCQKMCTSNLDWTEVDGISICIRCASKALVCEITRTLTLKPLVEIVNEIGETKNVLASYAKDFVVCACCNRPHINGLCLNGKSICVECQETECSQCDECNRTFLNEGVEDFEDLELCEDCLNREIEIYG